MQFYEIFVYLKHGKSNIEFGPKPYLKPILNIGTTIPIKYFKV